MCAAPFGGIGGLVMPLFGHARWPKNPKYCTGCYRQLRSSHGGAEIEVSILFAGNARFDLASGADVPVGARG